MSDLIPATLTISNDEPCFLLVETTLQSPGNAGWHRYQLAYVVRGQWLAEYREDLGPAEQWAGVPGFRALGGIIDQDNSRLLIEHTVGELRDIAEAHRMGLIHEPEIVPTDLIAGYHDELDARRRQRRHLTVIGPGGMTQRSA